MGTEDTIDIIVIGIIAIVVAYIVYEISQASAAINTSTGGWGSTILAALGGGAAVLFLL